MKKNEKMNLGPTKIPLNFETKNNKKSIFFPHLLVIIMSPGGGLCSLSVLAYYIQLAKTSILASSCTNLQYQAADYTFCMNN